MTGSQLRRLAALDALARDRGATESERALAASHAARLWAAVGHITETYVAVECDNLLVEAFDRAMKAAASVVSPRHREARIRWIEFRAGRDVGGQWRASRGRSISR